MICARRRLRLIITPKATGRSIGSAIHHHAEIRPARAENILYSFHIQIVIAAKDLDFHRPEARSFHDPGLLDLLFWSDGFLSVDPGPYIGEVYRLRRQRSAAQKARYRLARDLADCVAQDFIDPAPFNQPVLKTGLDLEQVTAHQDRLRGCDLPRRGVQEGVAFDAHVCFDAGDIDAVGRPSGARWRHRVFCGIRTSNVVTLSIVTFGASIADRRNGLVMRDCASTALPLAAAATPVMAVIRARRFISAIAIPFSAVEPKRLGLDVAFTFHKRSHQDWRSTL